MSSTLHQYHAAESLERHLGDPRDPGNDLSFQRSVELDEREAYPEESCERLYRWKLHHYYVPADLGGKLSSYEELLALVQVVARRDLSVAISDAHTFLGAVPVWIGGTDLQKQRLASFVLDEGAACLALTERAHGSDLLATETRARRVPGGYVLSGEKWPINKATRSRAVTILAKTDPQAGARGLSLFLVVKDDLPPASLAHLPKVRTLGIRACDISGLRLSDCRVEDDARIGAEGAGFDLTLKGFQLTRTLSAGLSLGAADTALRTTLAFALERKLYGAEVFAIPHARRALVNAFLDLLTCHCVSVAATRAVHVLPGRMSLLSAVVKYFVPTTVERIVKDLSVILGARHYLREAHMGGIFQKVLRDNAIISLFDGSTVVNLHVIALHLPQLSKRMLARAPAAEEGRDREHALFCLREPLPAADLGKLKLFSWHGDEVLNGLPGALEELRRIRRAGADAEVAERLIAQLADVLEETRALGDEAARIPAGEQHLPAEMFELAQRFCVLHAAAACARTWVHNREQLGGFFERGEWLVLCLDRLLGRLRRQGPAPRADYVDNVAARLLSLHGAGRLFSVVPLQLAGGGPSEARR